ncbi:MAG: hypothetical protein HFE63_06880 [Clostridiales bacterium]|nr:hypothetical protein [Clostridiales bacterium]
MYRKIIVAITFFTVLLIYTSCSQAEDSQESTNDITGTINSSPVTDINTDTSTDSSDSETYGTDTIAPDEQDIAAIINRNLDIIAEDFDDNDEYGSIAKHAKEFEEIVNFGEEALPYLDEVHTTAEVLYMNFQNMRAVVAMHAKYAIKPELYDREYPSPDGKYALKAAIESFVTGLNPFMGFSYYLSIIDTSDGSVLVTADKAYDIYGSFFNPQIKWSPDSQYLTISESYRHYYYVTYAFDIKNSVFVHLPYEEELNGLPGWSTVYTDSDIGSELNCLYCYFGGWGEDSVRINVCVGMNAGYEVYLGWYEYNFTEGKVTAHEYSPGSEYPSLTEITESNDIGEIINKNLDILIDGSDSFNSEQQFIDAHPDEYNAIISLGEDALPYLAEISSTFKAYDISVENNRGIMARAIEYAIMPELYDRVYTSPDGKYMIKAEVATFFGAVWGGGWTTQYGRFSVIDVSSDEVIVSVNEIDDYDYCTMFEVSWSPDGRYAAVEYSDGRFYTKTAVFDIAGADLILLPRDAEIKQLVSAEYDIDHPDYYVLEWLDGGKVKISIYFRCGIVSETDGWYVYDLEARKIVDSEYTVIYY